MAKERSDAAVLLVYGIEPWKQDAGVVTAVRLPEEFRENDDKDGVIPKWDPRVTEMLRRHLDPPKVKPEPQARWRQADQDVADAIDAA